MENLYTDAARLEADAVVLATGSRADDRLYQELADEVEELHRIGDCVAPRGLDHAVYEGELAGREPLVDRGALRSYEGELERWHAPVPA